MGTGKYLLALSKNLLTVDALNEKIEQGAEISDDGIISDYVPPEPPAPGESEPEPVIIVDTPIDNTPPEDLPVAVPEPTTTETPQSGHSTLFVVIVLIVAIGGVYATLVIAKRAKKKKEEADI